MVEKTIEKAIQEAAGKPTSGWRIDLGKLGEEKAVELLEADGWQILAKNWRCGRFGELDIVARDPQRLLVFCEVKTRVLKDVEVECEYGIHNEGFAAVHWRKQRKVRICAMNYLRYHNPRESACRFDVIAIEYRLPPNSYIVKRYPIGALDQVKKMTPVIRHVQGAFY